VTLTDSTVSGNVAYGGNGGGVDNSGVLMVTDSTISGTTARLSAAVSLTTMPRARLCTWAAVLWRPIRPRPMGTVRATLPSAVSPASVHLTDDADGTVCGFTATGDVVNVNPFLARWPTTAAPPRPSSS